MTSILPSLRTPKQAAEILRIPERRLEAWRGAGVGPAYVRIGRNVFYTLDAIVDFINSSMVRPRAAEMVAAKAQEEAA